MSKESASIVNWQTAPIMSAFSDPGTRVVFMGINGHAWQKADARSRLKVGETYTVRRTEVHSGCTNVWLEGFDVEFNSLHFTPANSTDPGSGPPTRRKKAGLRGDGEHPREGG